VGRPSQFQNEGPVLGLEDKERDLTEAVEDIGRVAVIDLERWAVSRTSSYGTGEVPIPQDGPEEATMTVRGIAGLMLDSLLTVSRALFEKGLPGHEGRLGFPGPARRASRLAGWWPR
jgi:hypothetical protein